MKPWDNRKTLSPVHKTWTGTIKYKKPSKDSFPYDSLFKILLKKPLYQHNRDAHPLDYLFMYFCWMRLTALLPPDPLTVAAYWQNRTTDAKYLNDRRINNFQEKYYLLSDKIYREYEKHVVNIAFELIKTVMSYQDFLGFLESLVAFDWVSLSMFILQKF